MNVKKIGKDLLITNLCDFNLKHIFDCGQCFRWNETEDGAYIGVSGEKALKIRQNGSDAILYGTSEEDFNAVWRSYFDLDTDYGAIKRTLAKDDVLKNALRYGGGIRILNQDLWETVVSFIISQSNNIGRIKGIIERLCAMYGNEIIYGGEIYYGFPDAKTLSRLAIGDLAPIRAGYRDKYIIDAAVKFASGEISEERLRALDVKSAKKELLTINGIGEKVANCIMLFALSDRASFPVDVWIKRIMEYYYFQKEESIGTISEFAAKKYGSLGGYAQQYLFYYAREEKIGT